MRKKYKHYVIAEIGGNHFGDLAIAKELIRLAAEGKASAVKFQKRNNVSLFTKEAFGQAYNSIFGRTYGEHREKLEFTIEEYKQLIEYTHEFEMNFIVTPFDIDSVDQLKELDVDAYKIASCDITNDSLINAIIKANKPILLSTGRATFAEVDHAVNLIEGFAKELIIMHCVSQYPCAVEHCNLNIISVLRDKYSTHEIGYSGHDIGIKASVVAYIMGANYIEKHFTLNKLLMGSDHIHSIEPSDLKTLTSILEEVSIMLGDGNKILNPYECTARRKLGKTLYFKRTMKKGSIIKKDDILIKSPGGECSVNDLSKIIGNRICRDVSEEEKITLDVMERI